ncbi:high-affnity carbon uptake protein Hat/HatR [Corallococcus coralloides]|uniref:High-affnity carbon uptake protein Hat/HatR n=1 Tax=Corallococcus coralloides TaxID=184914 RepID=A0A410RT28_CORCK|nr:hypothetical protein [Corallococcus coralloides]QAT85074.1 high-affnity carbon uptake protein Hat/HatR [Corallococcus coralloides]
MSAPKNPFLGPQPYRASDSDRFFGRETVTQRLVNRILAHPCLTLFGPSGAGKSSVMQAGVIPLLEESHEFRTVRIDGWLAGEAPLARLVRTMHAELELGPPPEQAGTAEALDSALELASQRSDRPVLIYLDQLEQLFLPGRDVEATGALLKGLDALARKPVRGLQLVLAMREDYLGRFRDRVRGRRELLEQGFRLGPLTVGEMVKVSCRLATEKGLPSQPWSEQEVRALMRQVRMAGQDEQDDDAEVQAAFAQIVCRALWDERARGQAVEPVAAEPMVHRYLEATLDALGSDKKRAARRLLEQHLIASDGSRTLLTEQEARAELPPEHADEVLTHLEAAAVLHAEQHQGSRYFELGHDWLARKVFELKQQRIERESAQRRLRREAVERRRLIILASVAAGVAVLMAVLLIWALTEQAHAQRAKTDAENAKQEADKQARDARGLALMTGARDLQGRGYTAMATKLLLEVPAPEQARWWTQLAHDFLKEPIPEVTFQGTSPLQVAAFSPDGQRVAAASQGGTAWVWRVDGTGTPVVLTGHGGRVGSIEFSPDGQWVVTASRDATVRVWRADGTGTPVVLQGYEDTVHSARFSPDGQWLVTASADMSVQVRRADGTGKPVLLAGHEASVLSGRFSPDGRRVVTTSFDGTARVWRADGKGSPVVLKGHTRPVSSAGFSPDGLWVVTASEDKTARVWKADGKGSPVVLKGHEGDVYSARFSPDGLWVVTASEDKTARVWKADGKGSPLVLGGHEAPVSSAGFSPDGQWVVTASTDGTARVWKADGMVPPRVLKGHQGWVQDARFSPDGQRIITASRDGTLKVWRAGEPELPVVFQRPGEGVWSARFSPDGQRVVTAGTDGAARVWTADGTGILAVLDEGAGSVSSAAFSPDGHQVVTVSKDGSARVWRADGTGLPVVLRGDPLRPIGSAEFSPEGQSVLTTRWFGGGPQVWRANGSGTPRVLGYDEAHSARFSRDGQWVVTASGRTPKVLRTDGTGTPVVLLGHGGDVSSAEFSPDGQWVVTASQDKTARVWKADGTGTPVVLKGHGGAVFSASFSPDGQWVVTASQDKTARVWKADGTGTPVVLKGHLDRVASAGFSPDGRQVVTASEDRTARVWRADGTGTPLVLQSCESEVASAEFSPAGRQVLTVCTDAQAQLWPLEVAELQRRLRAVNKDCLPPDVRRSYLDETEEQARSGYAECERVQGRDPLVTPPPTLRLLP